MAARKRLPKVPPQVDFVVISIIDKEVDAAFDALSLETFSSRKGEVLGTRLSASDGGQHFVLFLRATEQGCLPMQGLAQRAIDEWNPRHILVVGIAGGVHGREDDLGLGDLVVSANIEYYELEK